MHCWSCYFSILTKFFSYKQNQRHQLQAVKGNFAWEEIGWSQRWAGNLRALDRHWALPLCEWGADEWTAVPSSALWWQCQSLSPAAPQCRWSFAEIVTQAFLLPLWGDWYFLNTGSNIKLEGRYRENLVKVCVYWGHCSGMLLSVPPSRALNSAL